MKQKFVLGMTLGLVVLAATSNSSTQHDLETNNEGKAGYHISGWLLYKDGNPACGNVVDAVRLLDQEGRRIGLADCQPGGGFSFGGVGNGKYYVSPDIHASVGGVDFRPAYLPVTVNSADVQDVTFRGMQYSGYSISGRVGNVNIPAKVKLTPQSGASITIKTDPWGYYAFWGILNGTYTITVLDCNASSQSVTIQNGYQSDINFVCK